MVGKVIPTKEGRITLGAKLIHPKGGIRIFFGETLTATQILGAAIVLTTSFLIAKDT